MKEKKKILYTDAEDSWGWKRKSFFLGPMVIACCTHWLKLYSLYIYVFCLYVGINEFAFVRDWAPDSTLNYNVCVVNSGDDSKCDTARGEATLAFSTSYFFISCFIVEFLRKTRSFLRYNLLNFASAWAWNIQSCCKSRC